jgi:hypothetical protein
MYYYYKNSIDTVHLLLLLLFSLTVTLQFQAKTQALPGPSCLKHCGDVEIQYPFGVGDGCAMKGFELSCNNKDGRSILTVFGVIPVRKILLLDGQVRIMKHISSMFYNRSTKELEYSMWGKDLSGTPYTYSRKSNMFTVIGVNTFATMTDNVVSRLLHNKNSFIIVYG